MKNYRITYIARPLGLRLSALAPETLKEVHVDVRALSETDALTAFANVMSRLNLEASGYTSNIVSVTEIVNT